jgi:hypothetical protein
MTDERNINRGAIWGNKKKTKDTHPDFTGSINVGGIDYWLDGWKRAPDANANSPSMRFTVKPKEGQEIGKPVEDTAKTIDRFKQSVKAAFPGDDTDFVPF